MTIALIGILFAVLVIIGMPVSFAIGVAAMFGTLVLPDVDNATIVQRMLTAINTFPLLAVIFFIFAGQLMARGGVAGPPRGLARGVGGRPASCVSPRCWWDACPAASPISSSWPRCSSAGLRARPWPRSARSAAS